MMERFNEMCAKLYVKWQLAASDAGDSLKNEKGQSTVEYALIIVVVVGAVGVAGAVFSEQIGEIYETIMEKIKEMLG